MCTRTEPSPIVVARSTVFRLSILRVDRRLVLQVLALKFDPVIGRRRLQLKRDLFAGMQRSAAEAGGFGERVLLLLNGGHSAR